MALIAILIATFLISLIALIGIFTLSLRDKLLKSIVFALVALSAGALIGGAFLHLIPETLEQLTPVNTFIYLLAGFAIFFLTEKILQWRHCHEDNCPIHTFTHMSLFGDGIHNFIDGLIIAASFIADFNLGITTTLAVAFHEIPQEIGDFGVLIYGGFKKSKALLLNFLIALLAIAGGLVGYFLSTYTKTSLLFLLPFAAGGFIYIAASDLIPEMRKEKDIIKSLCAFIIFLLGIFIMYIFKLYV